MLPPCQSVRHNILTQVYTFVNAHMSQLPPKRAQPALDDIKLILHCHLQNSPSQDTTCSLWVVCISVRDHHNRVCVIYLELGLVYFLYVCECMSSVHNVINNGNKEPKACGCSLVRF